MGEAFDGTSFEFLILGMVSVPLVVRFFTGLRSAFFRILLSLGVYRDSYCVHSPPVLCYSGGRQLLHFPEI